MEVKVAVVIPAYKVSSQILKVISRIGPEISNIYVIDDACPEQSGKIVQDNSLDSRVMILNHHKNQGVGGATITGYLTALKDGVDIVVKLDGDGQMDPSLIPLLIAPIEQGLADYCKGNRFFALDFLATMPHLRKFGNSVLSFVSKLTSGYWNVMDPTNGFTAIHRTALFLLPLDKLDKGYFFESDMLFRLNTLRAVVAQIPMEAHYGNEASSLRISRIAVSFPLKYTIRLCKRLFYNYFLRDFNICSIELLLGTILTCFGTIFGLINWYVWGTQRVPAPLGTIMVSALPIIIGCQLLLAAISFDVMNIPKEPLQKIFAGWLRKSTSNNLKPILSIIVNR